MHNVGAIIFYMGNTPRTLEEIISNNFKSYEKGNMYEQAENT